MSRPSSLRGLLLAPLVAAILCGATANAVEVEITPHPSGANVELIVPTGNDGTLARWARNFTALSRHFREKVRRYNVVRRPTRQGLAGWTLLDRRGGNGHALLFGDTQLWLQGHKDKDAAKLASDVRVVGTLGTFTYVLVARSGDGPASWDEIVERSKAGALNVVGNYEGLVSVANLASQKHVKLNYAKPDDQPLEAIRESRYDIAAISMFDYLNAKNNKLRGLVVLGDLDMDKKAWSRWPDIKTPKQLGFNGISFPRWFAVHGDTTDEQMQRVVEEFEQMSSFEPYRKAFAARNLPVDFSPWPEAEQRVRAFHQRLKKLQPVLDEAGVALRPVRKRYQLRD